MYRNHLVYVSISSILFQQTSKSRLLLELAGILHNVSSIDAHLYIRTTTNRMSYEVNVTSQHRRISFPPEAIFQSVIQDGDNNELSVLLNTLQQTGLDIDQHNHLGLTPLHQCVLNNNLDGVKMLINYGADVNIADIYGITPLHSASACGFLQIASFLIIFGAKIFSSANEGDLPVDFATDIEMTGLLQTEMIAQIHSRTYLKSYVGYALKEWGIWMFKTCVYYISRTIVCAIEYIKCHVHKCHENESGKNVVCNKKLD